MAGAGKKRLPPLEDRLRTLEENLPDNTRSVLATLPPGGRAGKLRDLDARLVRLHQSGESGKAAEAVQEWCDEVLEGATRAAIGKRSASRNQAARPRRVQAVRVRPDTRGDWLAFFGGVLFGIVFIAAVAMLAYNRWIGEHHFSAHWWYWRITTALSSESEMPARQPFTFKQPKF
eukprot:TRINITY_DN44588_c0_g1_i1.p1 TRINITY_DN44588_c0_g1~~TRINITY_DN44588_c0_g1_i1.p1  ORF type:complete len:189 (+),score=75.92 TRINITY_DN44588_c0_g1_i1:44-568(+)